MRVTVDAPWLHEPTQATYYGLESVSSASAASENP